MQIRKLLRRGLLGVVLAVGSFHLAYAQDRPDHKNALAQIMSQLSDPSYSITKLQYANGFEKDQNNYIVFTTYTRVFKVSSSTFAKSISDSDNPLMRWAQSVAVSSVYGHFEPGDSFDESAQFRFLRTENGWLLQGFEGDEVIEARHTENADALDAQKKRLDEQRAQEEKVQRQKEIDAANAGATAAANERERHLVEVKNACASGQRMTVVGYGNTPVQGLQGARVGPLDRYVGSGQVVVGMPDDAQSLAAMEAILNPGPNFLGGVPPKIDLPGWLKGMCRVQYSVRHFDGNRIFSGYVPVERLAIIVQPPQGMVTGDPSAQKMEKIPLADALPTWTHSATGLMWAKSDNGSDVNWSQANAYCANLQLGGYSGWRLATIDELQGIYDTSVDIPGQCCNATAVSWHVKGNLHLSGSHWSSSQGNASGEEWVFIFLTGRRISGLLGNSQFARALCVRRSGE